MPWPCLYLTLIIQIYLIQYKFLVTQYPENYSSMCISVEQYRCAIGSHHASVYGKGPAEPGMVFNIIKIAKRLFFDNGQQTDMDNTGYKHAIYRHLLQLSCGMFLLCMIFLMMLTLREMYYVQNLQSLPTAFSKHKLPTTSRMPLYNTFINWLVIMLYITHPAERWVRSFFTLSYIVNFKRKTSKRFLVSNLFDKLSNCYVFFLTILNLVLIIITTPSIVNPGPQERSPTELKVCYCNIQGLIMMSSMRGKQPIFQTNKLLDFQNYLFHTQPDIVIVNESWLNEHIHNNEIVDENYYKIFRLDRSTADKLKYGKVGGGGVFILVRQDIVLETKLVTSNIRNFNLPILSIEIKFHDSSKICISTFYRYGYSDIDTFNSAETYYQELSRKYNKVIIIGDMNLSSIRDWSDPQSTSALESSYIELFNDLGLQCMINSPTHRDGNILDLLFSNQPGLIRDVSIEPDLMCPSDHFSISFKVRKNIPRKKPVKKRVFNYKEADWDGLNHDLSSHNWQALFLNKNITDSWNLFKSKLDIAMRKYIPMKNIKFRIQPPWFDSEIFEMSKVKKRLRKQFKDSQSDHDKESYDRYKTIFKQKIMDKKRDFVTPDPTDESDNTVSKKFWSYIKSNTKCGRIPEVVHYKGRYRSNKVDQCESFNKFFCDQFSDASNYNIEISYNDNNETHFGPYEIFMFLKKVKPNKAPGPDGITGHVLKNCAPSLNTPLSILFNASYVQGTLPVEWKTANVVPIHKKGRKDDIENYRPISLTSLVMKIFEKCLRNRIYNKCKPYITNKQHGFLPERSCTTQMLNYSNILSLHLNNKSQTDIIYFDFSKAFDSVNHDIILEKLRYSYGINGFLLRFIREYLRNRRQCVTLNGESSTFSDVLSGVPQGSILGPLFFVLFINDIVNVIDENTLILLYADDLKIFREVKCQNDQLILQQDIDSLVNWSVLNKIRFHPGKCKVLRCTLKKDNTALIYTYNMYNTPLEESKCEKDLGVFVTPNLKWNKQHSSLLGKASQKLGLLRRSCSFSKNLAHRKVLYLSIVRSQFEHCSQIWRPVNTTQSDKFEAVQKRGIKWIFCEDFNPYSKSEYYEKLKMLNILPLSLKFDYNDLSMFYKILYKPTDSIAFPDFLVQKDIPSLSTQRQTRSVSTADYLQFDCLITPKVNAFEDSFFHRTYKKWNNLTLEIRECSNLDTFQSQLKEHLWSLAEATICND